MKPEESAKAQEGEKLAEEKPKENLAQISSQEANMSLTEEKPVIYFPFEIEPKNFENIDPLQRTENKLPKMPFFMPIFKNLLTVQYFYFDFLVSCPLFLGLLKLKNN